ncbi:MAG: L,D-transpeptidase family protein [Candidatus Poribacteria bacterium]|nr:L,D-transpeptidase family protein [Candidatus Poribacteria bacterium]MDE0503315.1 L,D-transpeptidase family protein [Candidatus Poribacteria bacterium]
MRNTVAATRVTGSDDFGSLRDTVASIATGLQPIRQVVLVTAAAWTSDAGKLCLLSKVGEQWRPEGGGIHVMLGQNGMGWGSGVHCTVSNPPQKAEGDSKAPAGAFRLGPTFGYDAEPPTGTSIPYRCITEDDYYVDDVESEDYNRWVRLDGNAESPERKWNSWEEMKRPDHLYELGVVVEHNAAPVVNGRGSAIFLHVWQARGVPTAGCTAMAKDDLAALIRWLKPVENPCLIQAPVDELGRLRLDTAAFP